VWKFKAAAWLQTNAAVSASGWHLLPFMRSLQPAFYGLYVARDFKESPQTPAAARRVWPANKESRFEVSLRRTSLLLNNNEVLK
jgi:hypothetical protein